MCAYSYTYGSKKFEIRAQMQQNMDVGEFEKAGQITYCSFQFQ